MKNNDFAMLIVAILFIALASHGMDMVATSESVYTVQPGDIAVIPFSVSKTWSDDTFSSGYSLTLDPAGDATKAFYGGNKFQVYEGVCHEGETVSDSFTLNTPMVEGTYSFTIRYMTNRVSDGKDIVMTDSSFSIKTVNDPVVNDPVVNDSVVLNDHDDVLENGTFIQKQ